MARCRAADSDAPCCSRKAGPKRWNTSATSSPSRATKPAASGRDEVRQGWRADVEGLQRTGGSADRAGGDHQILRRGAETAMAEQQLDGAQIGAGFQQMHREGVAQRMRGNRLADAAQQPHCPAGVFDGGWIDRLAGSSAGKQPLSWTGAVPIVPQYIEELGRQHDVAVLAAFALFDPDDHALAVDRAGLERSEER